MNRWNDVESTTKWPELGTTLGIVLGGLLCAAFPPRTLKLHSIVGIYYSIK